MSSLNKEDRISVKIKFSCKCGNEDPDRFIMQKSKTAKSVELLCVFCERRYNIKIVSNELE